MKIPTESGNASYASWWPTLEPMQVAPPHDQILHQYMWCHPFQLPRVIIYTLSLYDELSAAVEGGVGEHRLIQDNKASLLHPTAHLSAVLISMIIRLMTCNVCAASIILDTYMSISNIIVQIYQHHQHWQTWKTSQECG